MESWLDSTRQSKSQVGSFTDERRGHLFVRRRTPIIEKRIYRKEEKNYNNILTEKKFSPCVHLGCRQMHKDQNRIDKGVNGVFGLF